MAKEEAQGVSPVHAWQVEAMRLTSFPPEGTGIEASEWWSKLLGVEPEVKSDQPRLGAHREEGPYENARLVLGILPGRVDWLFTRALGEEKESEISLTIGTYSEVIPRFLGLMHKWFSFETCPPAKRLALGAVLSQPVKNREEGYRRLCTFLPRVQIDPIGSSDFMYRINRPRASTIGLADLKINRLSTWSVRVLQILATFVTGGQVTSNLESQEGFACRLELDINTAPDFSGQLAGDSLGGLLKELSDLMAEITLKGDVP